MGVLWASPLPPTRTGVADHALELLTELRRLVRVRAVRPPDWQGAELWPFGDVPLVDPDEPPHADEIQLVHLGNNPFHEWLLPRLTMARTVPVVHDLVLHHLLVESTLAAGDWQGFERAMAVGHGAEIAGRLARARRVGVVGRREAFLFPARRAFLSHCAAAIVHSEWGVRRVAADLPGIECRRVGLAVADPGDVDRSAVRAGLGVDRDTVLVMHLGYLTVEKGLGQLLGAVAAVDRAGTPVHLVVVGEGRDRRRLDSLVTTLGLEGAVSFTGWVPDDDLRRLPAAADLGVALRAMTAGETSAAAVRFLACGTPVAVTGLHQFLEWPETAAPRVAPGSAGIVELARMIRTVAVDRAGWQRRRRAARRAYEDDHRPVEAAARYVEVLEELRPVLAA